MTDSSSLRWWSESTDLRETNASGARVRQLTSAPAITHDIYHEQPKCSADGNRLALMRTAYPDPLMPGELMLYDIDRYRITSVFGTGTGVGRPATSAWTGKLFAVRRRNDQRILCRIDLNTLEREDLFDWGALPGDGCATISPDGRWGLTSGRPHNKTFGVFRVDLHSGRGEWIHENPNIGNPHLQYRLYNGSRILVQENRGCVVDEAGNWLRPFDERGVGLYSVAADGSDRRDFPVGPPITPNTTGHECWIGDTDRVLVTLSATYDDGTRRGNVLEVRHEWDKARVVFDSPYVWNHISASRCGKYFVADSYNEPGVPILLGSIATGRTKILCDARTSGGGAQYSHAHPYLTSDNRWVVFNSDRTGLAQVYIASVPDGLLQSLDE